MEIKLIWLFETDQPSELKVIILAIQHHVEVYQPRKTQSTYYFRFSELEVVYYAPSCDISNRLETDIHSVQTQLA